MSNPSINRWGINTFWYNFWYSDNRYSENLKQDSLFLRLLNIYLYYGINNSTNIFANFYWYSSNFKKLMFSNYTRLLTFKNPLLGTKSSYELRQKTESIYPMKVWLLRYNNWIIVNLYWFQPFKKKHKNTRKNSKSSVDIFNITEESTSSTINRIKTILSASYLYKITQKSFYSF